uniref:Uncharacterized protein n=1 Tax=Ditylenchus dipsaci TaxID=166011 RepID=A0A915DVV8_9BILA
MAQASAENLDAVLQFLGDADQTRMAVTNRWIAAWWSGIKYSTADLTEKPRMSTILISCVPESIRWLQVLLNDGHMSNFDKLRRAERLDRTKLTTVTEMFISQLNRREILRIGADEMGSDEDVEVLSDRTHRLIAERLLVLIP